jgi:hypothetical protein
MSPPHVPHRWLLQFAVLSSSLAAWAVAPTAAQELTPLRYNHPGLVVDLGVGLWAWPLPMDFDGDGDYDLVVSCPDKPSNGTYLFENPGGGEKMPVFKPAVRLGPGHHNIRVSHIDGRPRVLIPAAEFADFTKSRFDERRKLPIPTNVHTPGHKIRSNQWHYVDYDGDGALDVVIGLGDWHDYGWDDAFDSQGTWTRGPLRGLVYLVHNRGTSDKPKYEPPTLIEADGKPVETFGWPSPNFADFDGDGDLDLLCGEFLDRFTYFENIGSRTAPQYAAGAFLKQADGLLRMDLQMIVPSAIDWDRDGDMDLIVGDEDGRVALVEHTGQIVDRQPRFLAPRYFQQQADRLKCGALATPVAVDWDDDGDQDIVAGNTAGYIQLYENLGSTGDDGLPKWAAPQRLTAAGKVIRILAGPNGSIQGPCEAKWGYTTLSAADWDHDGLRDLVVNSIWGEVVWYRNIGSRGAPNLAAIERVEIEWPAGQTPPKPQWTWWQPRGKQLVTQWRTTPVVADFTSDKLNDLVMLDHEGYLALFERRRGADGKLQLLPGRRAFVDAQGQPLQMNAKRAGASGRRKLHAVDWDRDGRLDLLANGANAEWWQQRAAHDGQFVMENRGPLATTVLAAHDTSPAAADFNRDGIDDLLVGAEDGYLYHMPRQGGARP